MREPFHNARTCLTILLTIEIIIGVLIIILTAIYHVILGSFLANTERKMLTGLFFNTYILGMQLIFTYLFSLYLWKRLWNKRCTPNVQLLISLWIFFCFLIVLCGFGTIWSLFICSYALESTAEMALLKGIDLYYTCPEWKLLWDGLQFHRECCGVNSFKDWSNAAWMPPEALESLEQNKCTNWKTTLAPYACCKHSCNACFESYVPRSGNSGIPYLNVTQINTNGCLEQFSESLWNILYILLALVLIAFKIDLIICCVTKYILRKQDPSGNGDINCCMQDDSGQQMVFVSYPPNVRCCPIPQEEDKSACEKRDSNEMVDPCICCSDLKRGYIVKQEECVPAEELSCEEPCQRPIQAKQHRQSREQSAPRKSSNVKKPRFVH